MNDLLSSLTRALNEESVAIVVGAGVSVSATGASELASWPGLLRSGIARCREIDPHFTASQAARALAQVEDGDIPDLLAVASQITYRLRTAKTPGEYALWLEETVGSLVLSDEHRGLIDAIRDLEAPILTTNYDSILHLALGRTKVIWTDRSGLEKASHTPEKFVVHVHGHWEHPESVVLGYETYDGHGRDEAVRAFFAGWSLRYSMLYVGVGGGIGDPNFDSLRRWVAREFGDSTYRDFRLVLGRDLAAARDLHSGDRIHPIAFGDGHYQLPSFIRDLARGNVPKVSQDPDNYTEDEHAQLPLIGVLDHAAAAEGPLIVALDEAGRVGRLVGKLENRSEQPAGVSGWDNQEKVRLASQTAASLVAPADELARIGDSIRAALTDADVPVARLLSATSDRSSADVRGVMDAIRKLRTLLSSARDRLAILIDDLTDRAERSGHWKPAIEAVAEAFDLIRAAAADVDEWDAGSTVSDLGG